MMRRHAKILCGFGSIEILCSLIALFVVQYTPNPWGFGFDDEYFEKGDLTWQLYVWACSLGIGFMGAIFLLVGCVLYLVSALIPMLKFKSAHTPHDAH